MAIDLDAIKAKLANRPRGKLDEDRQSIKWIKTPREGQIKVIFLPPLHGATTPGLLQYTHWNIPELNRLTCLRTFEKTCPLCEMLKEIQTKVPEDVLKGYTSQGRSIHNVIVLDDMTTPETEPCVLSSSEYTYWWLMQSILDPETGDITDVNNAHPVILRRVSAGGRFERIISLHKRPLASTQEKIQEILNKAPDLSKIWKDSDELYQKLQTAGKAIVEDLLSKSDILNNSGIPTPTQVQETIKPSESVFEATPPVQNTVQSSVQTPQSNVQAPQVNSVQSKASDKPKDAPACWGKHNPDDEKCELCVFELNCQEASK